MAQIRIAVIVGSLREGSSNGKLADALPKLALPDIQLHRVWIGDLPLFDQDHENDPAGPVQAFKQAIAASQGVIFVTPEYNRSIPGVLKNAIDHGSRPSGQSVWKGKPAAVIGVSPGTMGTALAQQHLRNVLAAVDMPVLPQPEAFIHAKEGVFEPSGEMGESSAKFVKGWLDAYTAFARKFIA